MKQRIERLLDDRRTIAAACACSLVIGLVFLFVWSPLPWGWYGIDHYHERAQRLAAGEPFDTTDVPWGYAYYLAAFYRLFGATPVPPLLAQAVVNALMPWLIYKIARPLVGVRVATATALLIGVFSFNTVYASTQSSDAICTVLFAMAMLCYLRGRRSDGVQWFAFAGLLGGLAAQFRPNLVLFPLALAALEVLVAAGGRRKLARAMALIACTAIVFSPWVVRNYRLTGEFLPTSTHGGIQLWLGTLQTGPYLESTTRNPRYAFQDAAFDYTVLSGRSIVVSATALCPTHASSPVLVYWTDRDRGPVKVTPSTVRSPIVEFELPPQPSPTALYYYLEGSSPTGGTRATPDGGPANPFVFFIADDHFTDLDRHDDLLDAFDVVRLLRHHAWGEPLRAAHALDFTGDGRIDQADLAIALRFLLHAAGQRQMDALGAIDVAADAVTLHLSDRSRFRVPREFSGKLTDVVAEGALASTLVYSHRTFTSLRRTTEGGAVCGMFEYVTANDVFYRREPHSMRRYTALAFDNIARDPGGFMAATFYRMFRLFIIRGTDDKNTAQQFTGSGIIYPMATLLSIALFATMIAGIVITLRRVPRAWPLLLPIVYVVVTLAPVLTNMRYSTTVQPFVFVFTAAAALAFLRIRPDTPASRT